MERVFYINMPVVIVSIYESLNLVKVRSVESNKVFYVDRKFWGCGRFLGPELSNSKTASILHRTQTP